MLRRVWAILLGLLLAVWPVVATADSGGVEGLEPEFEVESDAAHGQFSAGQFRHRVVPQAITLVRVGLARTSTSETSDAGFNHTAAGLGAEGDFTLLNAAGEVVATGSGIGAVTVAGAPAGMTVSVGGITYGPYAEPVTFRPAGGMAVVTYATRAYPGTSSKNYKYRGEIEVRPGSAAGTFRLVNVLNIDDYLRGLAELPTFWALEALKAQTVAARSYAAMRIGTPDSVSRGFDVYDTILSQAYNGALRETAKQDQAVAETAGLVVTHDQQVGDTYYSSSSGGHTESNEYVFAATLAAFQNNKPIPYLRGKFDSIPGTPDLDLTTEEGVRAFYSNTYPEHFDSKEVSANPYYRWTATWTRPSLESILNTYLRVYGTSGWVTPAFPANGSIGTLQDVRVEGRGTAGKALSLVITGSNGTWTVHKEFYIRWILRPSASVTLRSANFFLDITRDASGNISSVKATGGGFGHGVGMDQYGVRGMASKGYGFAEILGHYYSGAKVSTVPLKVRRLTGIPMDEAFRQQFYTPGNGTLVVTANGLKNLQAVVNGHAVTVNASDCKEGQACQVDISAWLQPGVNEIVYEPLGAPEGYGVVTVNVY